MITSIVCVGPVYVLRCISQPVYPPLGDRRPIRKIFVSQVAKLKTHAENLYKGGKLAEALSSYQELCRLTPEDAGVWHMLGVIYAALGDLDNAVTCARKTVLLEPHIVSGFRNLGYFLLRLDEAEQAEENFRAAVTLSGGEPRDLANLGASLAAQSRFDEAICSYRRALDQESGNADYHFNLGAAYQAISHWTLAAEHYELASKLNPSRQNLVCLAIILRACNRVNDAVEIWNRLLKVDPHDLEAMRNLAGIYQEYGKYDAAASIYEKVVSIAPSQIRPMMDLGLTYLYMGNFEQALVSFDRVLARSPRNVRAQYNRALALEGVGCLEEALEYYATINPCEEDLDIPGSIACLNEKIGDYERAYEIVKAQIRSGAAGVRTLEAYSRVCRHYDACEQAVDAIEKLLGTGDLQKSEQCQLHFRAGELYDRLQNYDEAFRHFAIANRMKGYRYSVQDDSQYVNRMIDALEPDVYNRVPAVGLDSGVTPIFIIGMPRSGTTLVEQILASLPDVHAAGELPYISRIASKLQTTGNRIASYPDYLPDLTRSQCEEMARAYLVQLESIAGDAKYVTDKMPHNFPFVALIHRLFPNAPVVHCQRDPVDICLSCYFQNFASYHNYAYDLEHLGQHYLQYRKVMEYYRDILHVPMFEMQYEDLVDDLERHSRALVEYCGITWDEACLRFYATGRRAGTASYDQVRQPIYRRSVRRWKNYEKYLKPLIDVLESGVEPHARGVTS